MKRKKQKKKNKRFLPDASGNVEFYKGGGAPPSPRDVILEPEGVSVGVVGDPTYRPSDPNSQGKPPGAVSLSSVEIMDAISEGPIEGLASGEWELSGYAGNRGYLQAIFKPFIVDDAGGTHASGFARSCFYNGTPVLSKGKMRNFQNVDVVHSVGTPGGENLILDSNSDTSLQINRSIGERIRGPRLRYKYKEGDYMPDDALRNMAYGYTNHPDAGGAYGGGDTYSPWFKSIRSRSSFRQEGGGQQPHGLKNGDLVTFTQSAFGGSNIVAGQQYYVKTGGMDVRGMFSVIHFLVAASTYFRLYGNSDLTTDPILFPSAFGYTDDVGGIFGMTEVSSDKLYSADNMELKPGEDPQGRSEGLPKKYKIINKNCRGVVLTMRLPHLSETLLTGSTTQGDPVGKGDVKATSVTYRIDYRPLFSDDSKNYEFFDIDDDGVITNPKNTLVTETVRGKISDGYARSTTIMFDLSEYAGDDGGVTDPDFIGWEICIYRETFDSFTSAHRNQTFIDSLTEIYEEKFCYPNTAFVRHRFRADTFAAVPSRTHLIRGLQVKVPNNYNPIMRTYGAQNGGGTVIGDGGDPYLDQMYNEDGDSIGAASEYWNGDWKRYSNGTIKKEWTNNPAWIYYDIITNSRYGLGEYVADYQVDKWSLFEIAKHCDELVPNGAVAEEHDDEPGEDFGECRFTANINITTQEDAFSVLNNFASIFRGLTFYSAGKLQATQDRPGDSVFAFTNANVINGDFIYASSAKKARHSVAIVRYNDEDNYYKPSIEYVEDIDSIKKFGIRTKTLDSFGTTTKNQAQRAGSWVLATERLETETCNFTAGIEGTYVQAGDIVDVADYDRGTYEDVSFRRRGGRCFNFTVTSGHNMDGQPNWTGRAVLDSSISGWLDGGSSYSIPSDGDKSYFQFNLVTPPAYGDPLTSDLTSSAYAALYNRKSAIQTLDFRKVDAGVSDSYERGAETGNFGGDLEADGAQDISDNARTIIEFTGLYHEGLNVLNLEDYNVTGFTGLLYDDLGNQRYHGANASGFKEGPPDSFIWSVEYTGAALDWKPDVEQWRVIGVEEKKNFRFVLSTVKHDSDKFSFVDNRYEPIIDSVAGLPDPPTSLDLSRVDNIPGLTAKKLTYSFSEPADDTDLAGYKIFIKRGSDFVDNDYSEDLWGIHPNSLLYNKFLPAADSQPGSIFIPWNNDTYYFRIYSVNKYGRSESRTDFLAGSVTINGINLIEDVKLSALSLMNINADMDDDLVLSSLDANSLQDSNIQYTSSNAAGTKDGYPFYKSDSIHLAWQCGWNAEGSVLAGLNIPSNYTYRVTFRKPAGMSTDFPSADPLLEVTGQNSRDMTHELLMSDNLDLILPTNYDYPDVFGESVTPLRCLDVVVEAVDPAGNSSAGSYVSYDADGNLTHDSDYSNSNGYDILYVENSPPGTLRLTKRLPDQIGGDVETCNASATSDHCTDQWLNPDGTLNFILKRDVPGTFLGQTDISNAIFCISRTPFTIADIVEGGTDPATHPATSQAPWPSFGTSFIDWVVSDPNEPELGLQTAIGPNEEGGNLALKYFVMGDGWGANTSDHQLVVNTPFKNVQAETSVGEVGSFTHVWCAVGLIDHFMEQAMRSDPENKSVLKKIKWSTNVVKMGSREAFLESSNEWRAWAVVNVNWDCNTNLNYHVGGFDTIELEDYAGDYYIRRAWSTGGKSPQTNYNYTTIQAMRKARKFNFSAPMPSEDYEIVTMYSPQAKWFRRGESTGVPSDSEFTYTETGRPGVQIIQAPSKDNLYYAIVKLYDYDSGEGTIDATFKYGNYGTVLTYQGNIDHILYIKFRCVEASSISWSANGNQNALYSAASVAGTFYQESPPGYDTEGWHGDLTAYVVHTPGHVPDLALSLLDAPKLPIYGAGEPSAPQIEVLEKTPSYFILKDTSLGGFGQGNRPTQGSFFIGILLGQDVTAWPNGFGQLGADMIFDYDFDNWENIRKSRPYDLHAGAPEDKVYDDEIVTWNLS